MDTSFHRRDVPFSDRAEAGVELARLLRTYAGRSDVVVLGLPRGGVPVAATVAEVLGAPLDVFVVRKLGVPGHSELAMGAIASGGARVINHALIRDIGVSAADVAAVIAAEEEELARREQLYRHGRSPLNVSGRTVILVDDGLATGSTMRAAAQAVRELGPSRVVVAVPVGTREACRDLERVADAVVCARTPSPFLAVGRWYLDFSETSDADVIAALQSSAGPAGVVRRRP